MSPPFCKTDEFFRKHYRFVPQRPDIGTDKPGGETSPEYEAFELCGPKEVLVMSSVGPWESVGGDIKFLRLMQRKVRPCSHFLPSSQPVVAGCFDTNNPACPAKFPHPCTLHLWPVVMKYKRVHAL